MFKRYPFITSGFMAAARAADDGAGGGAAGAAAAGGGDPAAATAAAASGAAAADWTTGVSPEVKSLIETKGYKSVNDLASAYINAERAIGADKLVLPGKDAKPEDWDPVHERLGWPKAKGAEGYAFQKPAGAPEGFAYSDESAAWFKKAAHDARLTPTQAGKLHDAFVGQQIEAFKGVVAQRTAEGSASEAALKTEWGTAYDTKVDLAKRAMRHSGGDELWAHLEKTGLGNNALLIKAFAAIGEQMGEKMADGMGAKPLGFAKTPEEAKREIAKIEAEANKDPKHPLFDKLNPEHQIWVDKLLALHTQAAPEPAAT